QLPLAVLKGRALRVVLAHRRQTTLQADELGAMRLTVLLQPVGEHQPRSVVLGVGADVFEKGRLLRAALLRHIPPGSVRDRVRSQSTDHGSGRGIVLTSPPPSPSSPS